ncbi:uncharacterized protein [Palaemon carinicauda]|uniref:uncharacterized protein n=1 Tax=Palaemon carinicauda TaxID=392227 RepID=UPI0035B6764B
MEDRDFLQFIWWPVGNTKLEPIECQMVVHPFCIKSSGGCVNYALRQTAKQHGHKFCNEASEAIMKNFCIDNLLKAHDDEERLKMIIIDVTSLCADGGWRLNQWTSSNSILLSVIPESERDASVAILVLSMDELPVETMLDMHCSMEEHCFTFEIKMKKKPYMRRGKLPVVASVYDSLGLISPSMLPPKILL